jgi:hypothetical protein
LAGIYLGAVGCVLARGQKNKNILTIAFLAGKPMYAANKQFL